MSGIAKDRVNSRGLWIAFFGPDGIGKSAVIDRLPEKLEGEFFAYTRFHFRPHFGRRQDDAAPMTTPHAQRPRGSLISCGKLLYWLFDCWLGYFCFVLPSIRRSGLVIFDRYLPDLLVDPVRYRLPGEATGIAALAAKLAPHPDMYILLDAPAERVQQRKQEMAFAESVRQRTAYSELFHSLPRTLVVDASGPVEEVTQAVAAAVSQRSPQSARDNSRLLNCQFPI